MCVRWHNRTSDSFRVSNGTRHLSPFLFASYIRDLLKALLSERVGCHIDGRVINVLAHADDLVLFAPSWYGMQRLLDVLEAQSHDMNMSCNAQKTVW